MIGVMARKPAACLAAVMAMIMVAAGCGSMPNVAHSPAATPLASSSGSSSGPQSSVSRDPATHNSAVSQPAASLGPCADHAGSYVTVGEDVKSLDLLADCSVTDVTGRHYSAIDVEKGAPAGSIAPGDGDVATVPGSFVITLEETIHGTANVYALFPAGVKAGFAGEGDDGDPYAGDISHDRLISMSGGPYVGVEYEVVAPVMLVRR